jgi:hypothetical protein
LKASAALPALAGMDSAADFATRTSFLALDLTFAVKDFGFAFVFGFALAAGFFAAFAFGFAFTTVLDLTGFFAIFFAGFLDAAGFCFEDFFFMAM